MPFLFRRGYQSDRLSSGGEGSSVRRRRQCTVCNERFTTFEVAELVMPRVVKSNDVREPFNEDKAAQRDAESAGETSG